MDNIKPIANINSSIFSKRILRIFTIKTLFFLSLFVIMGLIIMIVCFIFKQWITGAVLFVLLTLFGFILSYNYGVILNAIAGAIKYLFLKKIQIIPTLKIQKNFIQKDKKWYGFYLINSKSLINMDDENIQKQISHFSNVMIGEQNWSWLKLDLSFSSLKEQFDFLAIEKLSEWINNKNQHDLDNDIIAMNIFSQAKFTQEFITENFDNKDLTYLMILSGDSIQQIENMRQILNKNFYEIDFYLSPLNNQKMFEVSQKYFYENSQLKIDPRFVSTKIKIFNHPQTFTELYNEVVSENEEIEKETIGKENRYLSFIKITALPIYAQANFLAKIFNELDDVETVLHTFEIKEKKETKLLHNELENQIAYLEESKNYAKWIKRKQNFEALEVMIEDAVSSNARFQKYELILRISKNSKKELLECKRYVKRLLKSWHFEFDVSTFNQFDLLKAFNRHLNFSFESKKLNANMLSNDRFGWGYPFIYGKTKNDRSFLLGTDLENGQPIYKDFLNMKSSYKNLHSIYIGPTGSGKTEAIKYKILNNIANQRTLSIIIDPTGTLTSDLERHPDLKDLNKQVISMNNLNNSLNPFEMSFLLQNQNDEEQELQEIIDFMLLFFKQHFNVFTDDMKTALTEALKVFYNQYNTKDRTDYMDMFYEILEQALEETQSLQNINRADKMNLLNRIKNLTLKDGLTKYWAKPSSLKINDDIDLVIIDIKPKSSESELQMIKNKMLLIWLKHYVYNNLEKPETERKHIELICDEFSTFIQTNEITILSSFNELYKMSRKYDVAMTILLQNITTFSTQQNNTFLSEIWSNTQFIFLFQLQQNEINAMSYMLGDSLQLNDKERDRISNLRKGEFLLVENNKKTWVQIKNLVSTWFIKNNPDWNNGIKESLSLIEEYLKDRPQENLGEQ